MSRNEGEEGEGLFVWMAFFFEKANLLLRVTVVREGMPACEDRVRENTLQSDETRFTECITTSSKCCECGQVYSSLHFIITTSHDQFT